jgi:OOP family OmpA-OmpF porin
MTTSSRFMRPRVAAAAVATALAFAWGTAGAADWYVGAGGGQAKMKDASEALAGTSFDDKDTAVRAFAGYQIPNTPVGVEVGYIDFGRFTGSGVATSDRWEARGAHVNVLAGLPLNNQFSVFAKAGALRWRVEDRTSLLGVETTTTRNGTDFAWGVGAQVEFTRQLGGRLEWERFRDVGERDDTGRSDLDVLSASVLFRF